MEQVSNNPFKYDRLKAFSFKVLVFGMMSYVPVMTHIKKLDYDEEYVQTDKWQK